MKGYFFPDLKDLTSKECKVVIPAVNPRKDNYNFRYNFYNIVTANLYYLLKNIILSINSKVRRGLRVSRVFLWNTRPLNSDQYEL
jgi:hypothetical protein